MDIDLDACISGDKRAWDAFVERYAPVVYAAVRRTIASYVGRAPREDIDDAAQDVFLRLVGDEYRLLASFDPRRASLPTWLTVIARSTAIDRLRKRRPNIVPLDAHDAIDEPTATPVESVDIPLHLLTARQRLVLRLLFDKGLSVSETARIIGTGEQTVRSTKHKALTRLRDHLAPPGTVPDDFDADPLHPP